MPESFVAEVAARLSLNTADFTGPLTTATKMIEDFGGKVPGSLGGANESVMKLAKSNSALSDSADKAAASMSGNLRGAIQGVVAATGLAAGAFGIWNTLQVAARAEEMSVSLTNLGKNAGLTTAQIRDQTDAIKQMGITTDVAQYTMSQFLKAHLDTADAAKLARVAQDAAVYSMTDSSDALQQLVYGIQTYQTEIFRTQGLNINVGKSFEDYAKSVSKGTSDLTEGERQQAVMNAVLQEGITISGTYEASMGTGSKQLRSFSRYIKDAQETIGTAFLPAFNKMVFALAAGTKAFTALVEEGGALRSSIDLVGAAMILPFTMGEKISGVFSRLSKETGLLGEAFQFLAKNLKVVVEVSALLAVGFGLWRIGSQVVSWVLLKIATMMANKELKEHLVLLGLESTFSPQGMRSALSVAAAYEAQAAAVGMTSVALKELIATRTAEMAASGASVGARAGGGLLGAGASALGITASGAAMAAPFALFAVAGFAVMKAKAKEDAKTKQEQQDILVAAAGEGDPASRLQGINKRLDLYKQNKAGQAQALANARAYMKNIHGDATTSGNAGQAADYGDLNDAQKKRYNEIANDYKSDPLSNNGPAVQVLVAEATKIGKGLKAVNKNVGKFAREMGVSKETVQQTAAAMGMDLVTPGQEEEKALRANLSVVNEASAARQKFTTAMYAASDATKTTTERSDAAKTALSAYIAYLYDGSKAMRGAENALLSMRDAYAAAVKSGGNSAKNFKEQAAEHNTTILNSFAAATTAMKEQGYQALALTVYGEKFRASAMKDATAQGQSTEELKKYSDALRNVMLIQLAASGDRKGMKSALASLSVDVKFTDGAAIAAMMKNGKRDVAVALYPHIDYTGMSVSDAFLIANTAKETGIKLDAALAMHFFSAADKELFDAAGQLRKNANKAIIQRFTILMTAQFDPTFVTAMQMIEAAMKLPPPLNRDGRSSGNRMAGFTDTQRAQYDVWRNLSQAARDSLINPPNTDADPGATTKPDDGGKSAEEILREQNRMNTAMRTISSIAVPQMAQKIFDGLTKLPEREEFAASLKAWKDEYAKTVESIAVSSGDATAKIVVGWSAPIEVLKDVAVVVNQLGASFTSFTKFVESPNFMASGRSGDKIEEWVDGIIELDGKGLNPSLLRLLIAAGPDSLRTVRKLLRDNGALIGKENDQWSRIQGVQAHLVETLGPGKLGANFTQGVVAGMLDSNAFLEGARNFSEKLLEELKIRLGIKSPSTVAAKEIGLPIIEGILHAISSNAGSIGPALEDALAGVDSDGIVNSLAGGRRSGGRSVENHFHVSGFLVDKTSVDAMIEAQDWAMRTSGGL